jgi:hypothetical protein
VTVGPGSVNWIVSGSSCPARKPLARKGCRHRPYR